MAIKTKSLHHQNFAEKNHIKMAIDETLAQYQKPKIECSYSHAYLLLLGEFYQTMCIHNSRVTSATRYLKYQREKFNMLKRN